MLREFARKGARSIAQQPLISVMQLQLQDLQPGKLYNFVFRASYAYFPGCACVVRTFGVKGHRNKKGKRLYVTHRLACTLRIYAIIAGVPLVTMHSHDAFSHHVKI